jgi:hypothetical protein
MFWKRDDALAEAEQSRTGFRVRGVLLGGSGRCAGQSLGDVGGDLLVTVFFCVIPAVFLLTRRSGLLGVGSGAETFKTRQQRTLESSDQWVRNGRQRESKAQGLYSTCLLPGSTAGL